MSSLGTDWRIDDTLTFYVNTHDPTVAGSPEEDADGDPDYRVYEAETGTPILTGSMSKLDDANTLGFYSETITLSAANGLEAGKSYGIRIRVEVAGVAQSLVYHFRMMPTIAESTALITWPATRDAISAQQGMIGRNPYRETANEATFRNVADNADIAVFDLSDNTTLFTRDPQ